jgi:integrase
MAIQWIKTDQKGLRYYEHPTRKISKTGKLGKDASYPDRYYSTRYKRGDKDHSFGVGWQSDGIPDSELQKEPGLDFVSYCLKLLRQFKHNADEGEGPTTPQERQSIIDAKVKADEVKKARLAAEGLTFGAFMTETYLPQCKLDKKPKTYDNEEILYRVHLAGTIGALPFPKIAPFHLERIKKIMADDGKSPRTIQYVLQLTRQAFNTAHRLKIYTGESPTKGVKWPTLDNMKLRYLSIAEAESLLEALAEKGPNLHDMALLSLHCGLRFGEIASLTWSCVNWEAGTLAILNAKTGSRTAYLTARAKEMLQGRPHKAQSDLIFQKRAILNASRGEVMAQTSKVFADTVKELGLNEGVSDRKQKVTFHTLRHTYATHLYESTHDLYLTQRSLGHATGTMTQRYAKMSETRLRAGAKAVEKVFANSEAKQAGQVVNFTK